MSVAVPCRSSRLARQTCVFFNQRAVSAASDRLFMCCVIGSFVAATTPLGDFAFRRGFVSQFGGDNGENL